MKKCLSTFQNNLESGGKKRHYHQIFILAFSRHGIVSKYFGSFSARFEDIWNLLLYKLFLNLSKKLENVVMQDSA